jgi:hypothetical protein
MVYHKRRYSAAVVGLAYYCLCGACDYKNYCPPKAQAKAGSAKEVYGQRINGGICK